MRRVELAGVVALCCWAGSGWALAAAWPSAVPFGLAQVVHFGLITAVALLVARVRGSERPSGGSGARRRLELAGVGVMLFAVPALVLEWSRRGVPAYTEAEIFAGIPLVMAVLAAVGAEAAGEDGLGQAIVPGLMGLGGVLLLFPVHLPGSVRGTEAFVAVIVCAVVVAWGCLQIRSLLEGAWGAVWIAVANLVVFGLALLFGGDETGGWPGMGAVGMELARGAVFDLPVVLGTIWLMGRVDPERLSARFLLAPLVTVVGGYAAEPGPVEARTIAAVGLIAVGGVWVLLKRKTVGAVSILSE